MSGDDMMHKVVLPICPGVSVEINGPGWLPVFKDLDEAAIMHERMRAVLRQHMTVEQWARLEAAGP